MSVSKRGFKSFAQSVFSFFFFLEELLDVHSTKYSHSFAHKKDKKVQIGKEYKRKEGKNVQIEICQHEEKNWVKLLNAPLKDK